MNRELLGSLLIAGALALTVLASSRKASAVGPVSPPKPDPQPVAPPDLPPPPAGYRCCVDPVLPEHTAKAVAVLHGDAPMGSVTPFTDSSGAELGAFVTMHPKASGTFVRAVEIWVRA